MVSFPSTSKSMQWFFSDVRCEDLVSFWKSWACLTMELKLSWVVHSEPPVICQWYFSFSYSSLGAYVRFSSWGSVPVSCDCLYLLVGLYNVGGSCLPCDLTSFIDLSRVVDWLFSMLLFVKWWLPSFWETGLKTRIFRPFKISLSNVLEFSGAWSFTYFV